MEKTLAVLLEGRPAGELSQDRNGQLSFTYRDDYRDDAASTPLSLSMPLVRAEHGNTIVDAFLRGLLPDSEFVLRRWGIRFGVAANSPFALLTHVGEDVAGAAQFVRGDRLEEAIAPGTLQWVDEAYIANRLRILRGDRAAWDDAASPGQFSLAGAQSKFALYRSLDGRWALPSGRMATTHIIKPPLEHLAHQEVNEHLCLRAAALLGMRTARSEVQTFRGEHAIVVERYDRVVAPDGEVTRIHQEDACQALGVHPARKYEKDDGGPGAVRIIRDLFQSHQSAAAAAASAEQLVRALAFNWVVYGPDAHAKNYSLLLAGSEVALAPLYDISSVLPYPDRYDLRAMTMAMSINEKFQNSLITGADWMALARAAGLDEVAVIGWVRDVVAHAPAAFEEVLSRQDPWVRALTVAKDVVGAVRHSSANLARLLYTSDLPNGTPPTVAAAVRQKPVDVASYQRKDGTWVQGHTRRSP